MCRCCYVHAVVVPVGGFVALAAAVAVVVAGFVAVVDLVPDGVSL